MTPPQISLRMSTKFLPAPKTRLSWLLTAWKNLSITDGLVMYQSLYCGFCISSIPSLEIMASP